MSALPADLSKLKVVDLQKELKDRGLDIKGKKDELIKRLQDFAANGGTVESTSDANAATEVENVSEVAQPSNDAESEADADSAPSTSQPAADVETAAAAPEVEQVETAEAPVPSGGIQPEDKADTEENVEVSDNGSAAVSKRAREDGPDTEQSDMQEGDDATKRARTEASDAAPENPPTDAEVAQNESAAIGDNHAANPQTEADGTSTSNDKPSIEVVQAETAQSSSAQPASGPPTYSAAPPAYGAPAETPAAYSYATAQPAYGDAYSAYSAGYSAYGGYAQPYGAGGGSQSIVIEVPNDKVGLVIGKGGCTIKELEQRSGARVQITPDSAWQGRSDPRPIKLEGTPQQLDWVKQLVSEKVGVPVENLTSNAAFPGTGGSSGPPGAGASTAGAMSVVPLAGGQGIIVNVPDGQVGLVIGKQGSTIKMIEAQSGIKVQIARECPPETPALRPITLIGPPQQVEHARSLIQAKVENRSLPEYNAPAAHSYAAPYPAPAYGQPYGYAPPPPQYAQPYPQYDYSQQQQSYYYPQQSYAPPAYGGYYPPQ